MTTEPEPQQADASVLDLVRQYGATDQISTHGRELFARIAALLPQQPVQARDSAGRAIWQHAFCGDAYLEDVREDHERHCEPGPWRPLLVGGTPAPESECGAVFTHPTKGAQPPCSRPRGHGGEPDPSYHSNGMFKWLDQPDLIAQVMEALGVDRPEDVLGGIETIRRVRDQNMAWAKDYRQQRDEARAEVERLKAQVRSEIEQADERAAWADRLAWAILKRTGVREAEEASGNEELWQLALAALTARPDPLVLSLPEVPEGAVALVGVESGRRYARGTDSTGATIWAQGIIGGTLGEVLDGEPEGVTVEMAPPREPRAWSRRPLVEDPPDDLRVVRAGGGTGEVYRRDPNNPDRWVNGRGAAERWELLREVDLTEVFDDQS